MAYTIYLRTNKVNGKQYVGFSGDFYNRECQWKCLNTTYSNKYITEDRNEYGLDNFDLNILEVVDDKEKAYSLEEKYMIEYNTIFPNGYNITHGGCNNGTPKGKTNFKGKHLSEEHKKKLVEASRKVCSKHINQYTKDGLFLRTWYSSMDIERELGYIHTNIIACCKGKQKTAYGFIWKYADE